MDAGSFIGWIALLVGMCTVWERVWDRWARKGFEGADPGEVALIPTGIRRMRFEDQNGDLLFVAVPDYYGYDAEGRFVGENLAGANPGEWTN